VRAHVDRGIKYGILTNPNAILHRGIYRATNGTMGTNRSFNFNLSFAIEHGIAWLSDGFLHKAQLASSDTSAYTYS
jgi:hypothetical protein